MGKERNHNNTENKIVVIVITYYYYYFCSNMVEKLQKKFDPPLEALDNIPESPVNFPSKGLLGAHLNGLSTDLTRGPSKRKTSKGKLEEGGGGGLTPEPTSMTADPGKSEDFRDKLDEKEKEIALLRQQLKESKKREKRLQHKVNRYENATKSRRVRDKGGRGREGRRKGRHGSQLRQMMGTNLITLIMK